jgi:hypothetical protein
MRINTQGAAWALAYQLNVSKTGAREVLADQEIE